MVDNTKVGTVYKKIHCLSSIHKIKAGEISYKYIDITENGYCLVASQ